MPKPSALPTKSENMELMNLRASNPRSPSKHNDDGDDDAIPDDNEYFVKNLPT